MVQRKEREISHVKLHFSPHFGALLEALRNAFPRWKGRILRLMIMGKGWFSSLTSSYGICLQENVCGSTNGNKE
jgi:hypothetical protein